MGIHSSGVFHWFEEQGGSRLRVFPEFPHGLDAPEKQVREIETEEFDGKVIFRDSRKVDL